MIRRNGRYIQWIWAGIFSALFLARYASNQGEMVQPWEHWAIDSSLLVKQRPAYLQPAVTAWQSRLQASRVFERQHVMADSVQPDWLVNQAGWPDWKAERLLMIKDRWGGLDSSVLPPGYDQGVRWEFQPIPCFSFNEMTKEFMGRHPLIGWDCATAIHRYRSRVRPLMAWDEVWALAVADSTQQLQWPRYFSLE